MITPAMFAPGFMLGASTYNEELTLAASYYRSDIDEAFAELFLGVLAGQLESLHIKNYERNGY